MRALLASILALTAILTQTFLLAGQNEGDGLSFSDLKKDGIVSGFGYKHGDPLRGLNRISPISAPQYIWTNPALYPANILCIGTMIEGSWYFSPIDSLMSSEIINNDQKTALCYCPLAGLAVSIDRYLGVSGLLKYDTFVLYDETTKDLILPFSQEVYGSKAFVPLRNVLMMTYRGIIKKFIFVKILNPAYHYLRQGAYAGYSTDTRMGLGHDKPGLKQPYSRQSRGYHPKEFVLIIGFNGRMQKAYPFVELEKKVGAKGGSFTDTLDNKTITVSYYPQYKWAQAKDEEKNLLNVGYSYIFALIQHLPDITLYHAR